MILKENANDENVKKQTVGEENMNTNPNDENVNMEMDKVKKKRGRPSNSDNKTEDINELDKNIALWKEQYGKVFRNFIGEDMFIWRIIKRKEYKEMLREPKEDRILSQQESIVELAVLYPSNITELIYEKAGIASTLSEEILAKSGFDISETEEL